MRAFGPQIQILIGLLFNAKRQARCLGGLALVSLRRGMQRDAAPIDSGPKARVTIFIRG
jgi:hypothetical protein